MTVKIALPVRAEEGSELKYLRVFYDANNTPIPVGDITEALNQPKTCNWVRSFDGHFNISCADETGERANGNFKPDQKLKGTKWNFKYCPYCGGVIEL
jgi:hypothetical protein